jgi:methionyl-tRNA formyltransferase
LKKFIFIGGLKRGYAVLEDLLIKGLIPEHAFVLKEDEHEHQKYSQNFAILLQNKCPMTLCKRLSERDYQILQQLTLDFAIVCGWRTIIDYQILNRVLRKGMFAAHDSLLPKYRGFAPTNWAIINGEEEAGVSIFRINEGTVDSGEIYYQGKVSIQQEDNIVAVMEKVTTETVKGYAFLVDNLDAIEPTVQDESEATYCCSRTPENGKINWGDDMNDVYNLCRALVFPYSGAYFFFNNRKFLVNKVSIGSLKNYVGSIPGKVVEVSDKGIEVLCGTGSILIEELFEDSKVVSPNQFIKSIRTTLN